MSALRITAELEAEIAAVASSCECRLLQAEFNRGVLQILLDHPDGTTLQHCEKVSKQLSPILDLNDFGGGKYVLEVSSPGLDRPLFGAGDFRRFCGHFVRLTFVDGESQSKRTVVGELQDFTNQNGGTARIAITESGRQIEILLSQIQTARLDLEQELALGATGGRV